MLLTSFPFALLRAFSWWGMVGIGIGHDDLTWGGACFICRKAWDTVKYLIGSMNSSYDSPCGRFASASWVSISPGSISTIEKTEPMWFITIYIPGASPKLPLTSFFKH